MSEKITPEWLSVRSAAIYSSYGQRSIRDFLKKGLRHVRVGGGGIRIRKGWLDEFLKGHEVAVNEIDQAVNSVMADLARRGK